MSNTAKSLSQLLGNVVSDELLTFEFVEGTYSFDELKSIIGKRNFAKFFLEYLQENGITVNTTVKEGMQVYAPLKTLSGEIIKFWIDSEGNLADVTKFRPNTLY